MRPCVHIIEAAASLREAYGAEVIFVTGSTDQYTLDQIHKQVPGAPLVPKRVNHDVSHMLCACLGSVTLEPDLLQHSAIR